MGYFYADGIDKQGNRLLTSYAKQDQAKRYRVGAEIAQGERFLSIQDDGGGKLVTEDTGLLVRTLMVRAAGGDNEEMTGRFVVYARVNNNWQPTDFKYATYAKANAAVKTALINLYPACAIIEMSETGTTTKIDVSLDEEAVF